MKKQNANHVAHVRQVGEGIKNVIEDLARDNDLLHAKLATVEREKAGLERRLELLEGDLEARRSEQSKLMTALDEMTSDNSALHRRVTEVLGQSGDLMNLYVSAYQLHEALDHDTVLASIKEIVINIIGSEKFEILRRDGRGEQLVRVGSFGLDDTPREAAAIHDDVVGQVIRSGELHLSQESGAESTDPALVACVPLLLQGEVYGAIAIYELLPQKPALGKGDLDLFDLLSTQAASALYCAELYQRRQH